MTDRALVAFALMLALACGARAEPAELTVWSALDKAETENVALAFRADHPEVATRWVPKPVGAIEAELFESADPPPADVVWGLAATSLLPLADEGRLQPYAPEDLLRLDPRFHDRRDPPRWIATDAWVAAICVNRIELGARKLPVPTTWKSLIDPAYQGLVSMPSPKHSETGFLNVSSWLQLFGENAAWDFMNALHLNIAQYTRSGSAPCTQAARGEVAIGISYAFRTTKSQLTGAPLEIVVPTEGVGWELQTAAIVVGTTRPEAARTLLDWAVKRASERMIREGYAVHGVPGLEKTISHGPPDIMQALIDNDFVWAAGNRERIIEKWQRRYGAKIEPEPPE